MVIMGTVDTKKQQHLGLAEFIAQIRRSSIWHVRDGPIAIEIHCKSGVYCSYNNKFVQKVW